MVAQLSAAVLAVYATRFYRVVSAHPILHYAFAIAILRYSLSFLCPHYVHLRYIRHSPLPIPPSPFPTRRLFSLPAGTGLFKLINRNDTPVNIAPRTRVLQDLRELLGC